MKTLAPIDRLIACLTKLPGIGRRSAERIAYELVSRRDNLLQNITAALQDAAQNTTACSRCGAITGTEQNPCFFCVSPARNPAIICVVETAMDLFLVENTGSYSGRYHVLGGKISPMRGLGPDHLKIEDLRRRVETEGIKEVILALNADVESDATASMLKNMLESLGVAVSRPATGLPAGSGIAYIDRLTLNEAMENRHAFQPAKKTEK
jgi:recombination protein RecR